MSITSQPGSQERDKIIHQLSALIEEVLPNVPEHDALTRPFLEMGANSLVLMELQKTVEEKWGLQLKLPMFFEELTNLGSLVDHIEKSILSPSPESKRLSPSLDLTTASEQKKNGLGVALPPLDGVGISEELKELLSAQIDGASQVITTLLEKQLAFLAAMAPGDLQAVTVNTSPTRSTAVEKVNHTQSLDSDISKVEPQSSGSTRPQMMLQPLEIRARGLTEKQHAHLEALIERYTRRTAQSKNLAAKSRKTLADSRASVGFRFTTKEMLYPIVGARASGSRIWDIDDNEYIDITMGQGVTLFGHHPPFIDEVIRKRFPDAMELGPRPPEVTEVATLLAELTGMERFTFTNSGTEAVMAAIRLARAATGRGKIVMFQGSYHGHADNVMGVAYATAGSNATRPASAGIPTAAVQDLIILEYGEEGSLEEIRKFGSDIAAVLVEPVQSRRPDLQPRKFLQELRTLTREVGALLVFDEMITGFRVHQQGAQGWFGVEADIATYGKVIGGGLPIGVVAGRNGLMDPIDGGAWSYEDSSYPAVERIIFGGTFCQHPLVMATTLATLKHLKKSGPKLQEDLNNRTQYLKTQLNQFFETEQMPISVVNFGSLFRFEFKENLELLFYHLMEKGVFIWEWRNYFLSTAHSDQDISEIIDRVSDSATELRNGGFLRKTGKENVKNEQMISRASMTMMSAAQRQLQTLTKISATGSKAYQVGGAVELTGPICQERLKIAFLETVAAHDALTLVPGAENGELSNKGETPKFEMVGELSNTDNNEEFIKWLDQPLDIEFDLKKGPLLFGFLAIIENNKAVLRLVGHHFALDGISLNLLFREILERYQQSDHFPTRNPMQFSEYLQHIKSQDFSSEKEFWAAKLANARTPVSVPADLPVPAKPSYIARRFIEKFTEAEVKKIKRQAVEVGCTEFMYVFALFSFWLGKLVGESELTVGVPVAGRPTKESMGVVGYCTHLLPILIGNCQGNNLSDHIASVRRVLLESYEHQALPYAEIMDILGSRSRAFEKDPLVSVIFNFDEPGELKGLTETKVRWLPAQVGYTAYELTCNFTVADGGYYLEFIFQSDRTSADLAKSLGEGFASMIRATFDSRQGSAICLPTASPADIFRQAEDFIEGDVKPFPETILDKIEEVFKASPQRVAIEHAGNFFKYCELDVKSAQIAGNLKMMAMEPSARIIVCAAHSMELVAAMVGVLRAGMVFIPVDPVIPAQRAQWIQEDSNAHVILVDESIRKEFFSESTNSRIHLISDLTKPLKEGSSSSYPTTCKGVDPAYLLYTSGSTGKPKGVVISHRAFANYSFWASDFYKLNEGTGVVLHGSISFDATLTSIFPPLLSAQSIIVADQTGDPVKSLADLIGQRRDLTMIKLTPAHLELLNSALSNNIPRQSVRVLILGGEALKSTSVTPWIQAGVKTRVINEYGPTETVVGCCVYEMPLTEVDEKAVPIGRPIQNTALRVVDSVGNLLPIGVPGELFVSGAGVAEGYLNQPDLTEERFVSFPDYRTGQTEDAPLVRGYLTGDRVRWGVSGILHYLGREDDQIQLRGFRIEPEEIENAINQLPGVCQSAVTVHNFSAEDARLIAYLVTELNLPIDASEIRRGLMGLLPAYMVPAIFRQLESLPINTNGKLDRRALGAICEDQDDRQEPSQAVSSIEQALLEVWASLLRTKFVPVNTNFFDLGGHSLLVIKMVECIETKLSVQINPIDIYQSPTISLLADLIKSKMALTGAVEKNPGHSRRGEASRIRRNRGLGSTPRRPVK
ncbi:MAG: amino acid adenylation domain-containing protein [Acidiferrobacteraceae bacterium]|nr:amino acid adenylation domain-containing protein [Acidiferrobacteraceae bacterium]